MVYCCVPLCHSEKGKVKGVTFHEFPSEEERRLLWLKNISRKDWIPSGRSVVCSLHFKDTSFREGLNRKMLKKDAIPTVFPGYPTYLQPKVRKERKANRLCVRDIQKADNTDQKIAHGDHLDDHNYCTPVDKRSPQKLKRNLLQQTDENEATRKKVKLPNQHSGRKKICQPEEVISELQTSSDGESQEEGSEASNDDLEKKEKNQTLTDEFDPLLPSVQMLPKNLRLKKSDSNEKEYGIWSSTKIAKGVIFGPFNGIYLNDDDGELDENDYRLKELKDNDIVYFMNNKNNKQADWFQYVNFAYHKEQQNLVVLKCGGHVYYETIKDILPDSELLVQFSHKRDSRRDDHSSKTAEVNDLNDGDDEMEDEKPKEVKSGGYLSKQTMSEDSEDEAKVVKKPRGRPRKHFSKQVDTECNTDLTKRDKSLKSYDRREKISSGRRKKCVDGDDFNKTIMRSKNCGDEAKISSLRTRKRLDDTDLTKITTRSRRYCDEEKNSPTIVNKRPAKQGTKHPVDDTELTKRMPKIKNCHDIKKIGPLRGRKRSFKKDTQHPEEKTAWTGRTTRKNCRDVKKISLVRRR